ncbi:DUF6053 domain-containing protein [Lysobacter enzymogenes]|uniref:DUF6053 domain-containing protein n=1 Tax=Lysobacter enzymogenes TaxID=69 RepID=UPI003CCD5FAA
MSRRRRCLRGDGSCGRGFSPDAIRSAAASRQKSAGPEGPPTKALQTLDSKVVSRQWPSGGGSCGRGFSPDAVRSAAASWQKSVGPEGPPAKASAAARDPGLSSSALLQLAPQARDGAVGRAV